MSADLAWGFRLRLSLRPRDLAETRFIDPRPPKLLGLARGVVMDSEAGEGAFES